MPAQAPSIYFMKKAGVFAGFSYSYCLLFGGYLIIMYTLPFHTTVTCSPSAR